MHSPVRQAVLSIPPSIRIFVHLRRATDMRNYAVTVIMPSRPLPTQTQSIIR